tara:strand:- start:734 stop:1405 length:672 start_codon:yes stop_codon:yes gene_type:complete
MENKIDITNKECLESLFAEDFSSPYFPVLANLYMQEGDLRRAKLVCNTGLQYDSENHIAKFILAKIAICEEKPLVAEKLLKQLLVDTPCNFVAIRTLINLEFQLNRSPNTIYVYIQKILDFLPNDIECNSWLEKIKLPAKPNNNKNTQINKTDKIDQGKLGDNNIKYNLEKSMATLTMVKVLKSQKHYHQALDVLDILKQKNIDLELIESERKNIVSKIKQLK